LKIFEAHVISYQQVLCYCGPLIEQDYLLLLSSSFESNNNNQDTLTVTASENSEEVDSKDSSNQEIAHTTTTSNNTNGNSEEGQHTRRVAANRVLFRIGDRIYPWDMVRSLLLLDSLQAEASAATNNNNAGMPVTTTTTMAHPHLALVVTLKSLEREFLEKVEQQQQQQQQPAEGLARIAGVDEEKGNMTAKLDQTPADISAPAAPSSSAKKAWGSWLWRKPTTVTPPSQQSSSVLSPPSSPPPLSPFTSSDNITILNNHNNNISGDNGSLPEFGSPSPGSLASTPMPISEINIKISFYV
jgi:hypothetical protein